MSTDFRVADAASSPGRDLIAAVLMEYDAMAGVALRGGPSATADEFSPPHGAYVVGYVDGVPGCGGGVKGLGGGIAELKRMYVAPSFRGRGLARELLGALEDVARDLGHHALRLDSQTQTWPMYLAAGYRAIDDYNDNPYAQFWGEKQL
jgi:GNAT superfamily N-acetyltransferase